MRYSLKEWGPIQRNMYLAKLQTAVARLAEYPELGAADAATHLDARSFPVGSHKIMYEVTEMALTVLSVTHQRMDSVPDED